MLIGMTAMVTTSTKVCASVASAKANVLADSAPTLVAVFSRGADVVSDADVPDR